MAPRNRHTCIQPIKLYLLPTPYSLSASRSFSLSAISTSSFELAGSGVGSRFAADPASDPGFEPLDSTGVLGASEPDAPDAPLASDDCLTGDLGATGDADLGAVVEAGFSGDLEATVLSDDDDSGAFGWSLSKGDLAGGSGRDPESIRGAFKTSMTVRLVGLCAEGGGPGDPLTFLLPVPGRADPGEGGVVRLMPRTEGGLLSAPADAAETDAAETDARRSDDRNMRASAAPSS